MAHVGILILGCRCNEPQFWVYRESKFGNTDAQLWAYSYTGVWLRYATVGTYWCRCGREPVSKHIWNEPYKHGTGAKHTCIQQSYSPQSLTPVSSAYTNTYGNTQICSSSLLNLSYTKHIRQFTATLATKNFSYPSNIN